MAKQRSNASKDSIPQSADSQSMQDVQDRLDHWVTNESEGHDLANSYYETLPLPVLLLHLYRDLLRFYEQRLNMSQSRVMLLHELMHTGEINQTELAQRLGMETALVTRFAKQMEASGLLSRRVDPRDNRFMLVSLTPTGQQVFQEMMVFSREFEALLVEGLSNEEEVNIRRALIHIQEKFSSLKQLENELR
ncbi:MAG: MarR family transcriptional regulator [Ktedonobacteraceae bacterium]|nr:MarR family transcriptional regulator [Ktedonobacteraceae bacterium]